MIKRIELVNFMSHAHTVIEPANGLTVLVGPNNCGKSSVMTALQILCHNENSTYVTRHGEKECSITVETNEGDTIQWVRIRNTTKYVINGETFDRLRGKTPPILHQILRLPKVYLDQSQDEFDIHFGSQKNPVFLINDSGRAAAGFFAASSDASRFIEMQKLHSQKVKDSNRELKRLDSETNELANEIELLKSIPELKNSFEECGQLMTAIENHEKAASDLRDKIEKLVLIQSRLAYYRSMATAYNLLQGPPAPSETSRISNRIERVVTTQNRIKTLSKTKACFTKLSNPPTLNLTRHLEDLVQRIDDDAKKIAAANSKVKLLGELPSPPSIVNLEPLKCSIGTVSNSLQQIEQHRSQLAKLKKQAVEIDQELVAFAANNPMCPTCEQPLTEEHLKKQIARGTHGEN